MLPTRTVRGCEIKDSRRNHDSRSARSHCLRSHQQSTVRRRLQPGFKCKNVHAASSSRIPTACLRPAANSYCLPAASSQPGCRQPASQRRRAQPAATASLRMPPHGGSPASYSSHRLVAGLPSGIATMQMDNLRQKPGAIVISGARMRAHAELNSEATRRPVASHSSQPQ
jgi:hypothetical protein